MRYISAFIKSQATTNILLFIFIIIQGMSLFFISDTILNKLIRSNKEIRDEIDRVVNHMPYVNTIDIETYLKSIKEDVKEMRRDVENIKESMWTLEVNTKK